jgi:hypothetical protein
MTFPRRKILIAVLLLISVGGLLFFALHRWHKEEEKQLKVGYTLIEDKLYMGGLVSEPPPETTAVLNLCEQPDPYQCEVHLWKPIRDSAPAPNLIWLGKAVEFIDEQQQAGRTTYVHCANGASRSGMVVIAYVMYKKRWPRDQALEFVRSRRPETRPNPAFMQLLLEWERALNEPQVAGIIGEKATAQGGEVCCRGADRPGIAVPGLCVA